MAIEPTTVLVNESTTAKLRLGLRKGMVLEIVVCTSLTFILFLIYCAQPNGTLSPAISFLIDNPVPTEEAPTSNRGPVDPTLPTPRLQDRAVYLFCMSAELAHFFGRYTDAVRTGLVIPFILLIHFAYNNVAANFFYRGSRVVLALLLFTMMAFLTLKPVEIETNQAKISQLKSPVYPAHLEDNDYGCRDGSWQVEPNVSAALSAYLGDVIALFGEARIIILGLFLWLIGKSVSDLNLMRDQHEELAREQTGERR